MLAEQERSQSDLKGLRPELRYPQFREVAGITVEHVDSIKQRFGWMESTLNGYMKNRGFPKPYRFSRVRYFNPREVDDWFMSNLHR